MIIVVEITSQTGSRACKEYDAPNFRAAVAAAERDLRSYPQFEITGIWSKLDRSAYSELEEEW